MILYVNGDSHTAAAEAVNNHAFACDDGRLWQLGRRPHPDNERVSWGYQLAGLLEYSFLNQSESASSNSRILRAATEWIDQNHAFWDRSLMVIQWSTWEREEWLIDGEYYQVNASGIDLVPESHQDRYREFVVNIDWDQCAQYWHDKIWRFHLQLEKAGIRHLFFNGNNDFSGIHNQQQWNNSYLMPYDSAGTFDQILKQNSFKTVNPHSWHFGPDAHCFWANYLLQYCIDHNLVEQHAIPTD